jgi:hypothetical protein
VAKTQRNEVIFDRTDKCKEMFEKKLLPGEWEKRRKGRMERKQEGANSRKKKEIPTSRSSRR